MFSSLLETYKAELGEFVQTVREDSTRAFATAADKIKQMNEQRDGSEEYEDEGEEDGVLFISAPIVKQPPLRAASFKDMRSMIESGNLGRDAGFVDFAASFDLDARSEQVAAACGEASTSALLAELTAEDGDGNAMSEREFWTVYFYFQHVQRRAKLLAGELSAGEEEEEEELSWGEDDEEDENKSTEVDCSHSWPEPTEQVIEDNAADSTSAGLDQQERKFHRQTLEAMTRKFQQADIRAGLAEEKVCVLTNEICEIKKELHVAQQKMTALREQLEAHKSARIGECSPDSWHVKDSNINASKEGNVNFEDEDEDIGWD